MAWYRRSSRAATHFGNELLTLVGVYPSLDFGVAGQTSENQGFDD